MQMYEKYTFHESILHVQGAGTSGSSLSSSESGGHYFPQMGGQSPGQGWQPASQHHPLRNQIRQESQPSKPPSEPLTRRFGIIRPKIH
jgi:hypothetical protein